MNDILLLCWRPHWNGHKLRQHRSLAWIRRCFGDDDDGDENLSVAEQGLEKQWDVRDTGSTRDIIAYPHETYILACHRMVQRLLLEDSSC
jgi:hypothetical protein